MASYLILSGLDGKASITVPMIATNSDFEQLFPSDLKAIFLGFKDFIVTAQVYDKLVPVPSKPNCVMVEYTATAYQPKENTRTCTFKIGIFKARPDISKGQDSYAAAYTMNKILRLLAANHNFMTFAGIQEIESLEGYSGSDSPAPEPTEEEESYTDTAVIIVTYKLSDSHLNPAN